MLVRVIQVRGYDAKGRDDIPSGNSLDSTLECHWREYSSCAYRVFNLVADYGWVMLNVAGLARIIGKLHC